MSSKYDVVVIGSGPGGYTAAIRAAQLGFQTVIIEKYNVLGGTCTNVGCIPSKALLDSSEHFANVTHKFPRQGIIVKDVSLDFDKFIQRKADVVRKNTDGISYLMKKNKIEVVYGEASFKNADILSVKLNSGETAEINAQYFIVATGSKPSSLPGLTIDKERIITSTEALSLKARPSTMVIIGGGVIGVEMASIFQRIGTRVTVLEYMDNLVASMDKELGAELKKILTKQGIKILTGVKVNGAVNLGEQVKVSYSDKTTGALTDITGDYCLVAVGRSAYTNGLNLENTKVKTDNKGRIITNEKLQTAEPNVYAIGDVVAGPMLAHKAEDEGVFVAEILKGLKPHIKYHLIPLVVYTWPEVASAGFTEEQLVEQKVAFNKGKFPFMASGRARASDDTDGFVKVLSDPKYGEVLGVHIIGPRAADMIAEAVIAMEFEITDIELGKISYAHPTFSEAMKDAYLIASGRGAMNM